MTNNNLKLQIDYSRIYSVSRLKMFDQCQKQYEFNYVDPIYKKMKGNLKKMPENIFSFNTVGKAVHNAITLFYYLPENERNFANLKNCLKNSWLSEARWNKKPPLQSWGGFKSLEEEREEYRQALYMLENFLEMTEVNPEIEFLPTGNFKRSIDDFNNFITEVTSDFDISGKFDLITKNPDNSLNIIDFKTSKRQADENFQLKFYKLLAELKLKKPVTGASFYYLKQGEKKDFNLENEDKEKIKKEIEEKVKKVKETQEFEPKTSPLCRYCLFKTFCPKKAEIQKLLKSSFEADYPEDLPF